MFEVRAAWVAAARRLGLSLVLYALPAVGFLLAYRANYGAPTSTTVPHLWVLATFVTAVAGLRLLVHATPIPSFAQRFLAAALTAIAALGMLAFYAIVLTGLHFWGRVTSVELLSTYVPQTAELLRALGIPLWTATATGAVAVVATGLLADRFLRRFDWIAPLHHVVRRTGMALTSALLLAIVGVSAAELPHRDWAELGEPLSLSLYPQRGETVMQTHAISQVRTNLLDIEEASVRAAYRPNANARHSNVIIIVADAMRADHLSALGYFRPTTPRLDALTKQGAARRRTTATAVCNESSCGLRALASSRYVDRQAGKSFGLQEVLRAHGYKVHLILSGDHTNFYGLRQAYGTVDSYFDGASQSDRYVNDDRLVLDRLRALGRWDGRPVMMQFHLMSTHSLGLRFDDTHSFGPAENYARIHLGAVDTAFTARAVNFYDQGILQADRVIDEILTTLDAGGYLRDAIVVVTGDHGESLGERGLFRHGHSVWQESLSVPLLILAYGDAMFAPMQAPRVASQIDIAPTILAALDMPTPASWEGQALQKADPARVVYFQQRQYIGLIDARGTYARYKHWHDTSGGVVQTFDLESDPGELRDVSASVPLPLMDDWRRQLLSRSATIAPNGEGRKHSLEQALRPM